ncbi:MAG: cold shock domain-containing protein [Actinobacteria bacterium]|nr:cold shock domain-containing protein [Actinomycetota bacterium]
MSSGKIKCFFQGRGFGFITSDNGKEVFFHISALVDRRDVNELSPGKPVEFELQEQRGKECGVQVRILKDGELSD